MNDLFLKILENSLLTSAAALLLIFLSRLLHKKTKPQLRYMCWVIITLCFLVPLRPSLFTLNISAEKSYSAASAFLDSIAEKPQTANTEKQTGYINDSGNTAPSGKNSTLYHRDTPPKNSTTLSHNKPIGQNARWLIIIFCGWIMGAFIALAFYTASYISFLRIIKQTCTPITHSVLNDLLDDICGEIGLKHRPRLAMSPVVCTPVVVGFFRPSIFLPCDFADYQKLRFILLHEALHVKGGHMWGKLLSLSTVTMHWFNPMVYIINRAMLTESELACDAAVLRYVGEEQRAQYGETILQTAKSGWRPTPALVSTFSGNRKNLKHRLSAIVERNTTRRWIAACCAAVMLSGTLLTGLAGCTLETGGIVEPIPDAPVDLTPTDKLVIYIPNFLYVSRDIEAAVSLYEKTYKNVSVTLEIIGEESDYLGEQYMDRINSELMAGKGPDIVLVNPHLFPDIYKTMDTGAFLNLSSVTEQDADFRIDDYYQPVIDVGLYKGGRYIVPYSFSMPFLFGLQEQLDAVGFDISKNTGFVPFFEEMASCLPKLNENPSFTAGLNWVWYIFCAVHDSGLALVDYEHKKVLPDEAAFKAFCEAFKPYWEIDYQDRTATKFQYDRLLALKAGDYLFSGDRGPIVETVYDIAEAKGDDSAWVISAMRRMDGGINATIDQALAVRAGSSNQLNAWNFIKLMLSKDIQMGGYQEGPTISLPVNRKALSAIIDKTQTQGGELYSALTGIKWVPAVAPEEKQPIYKLLDDITGSVIWNYATFDYFYECMTPWFNNEKSYDECVKELKRKLEIYVSE